MSVFAGFALVSRTSGQLCGVAGAQIKGLSPILCAIFTTRAEAEGLLAILSNGEKFKVIQFTGELLEITE